MRALFWLPLLLALPLPAAAAPPDARTLFDDKCLFCHSDKLIAQRRFSLAKWRQVVHQMRQRAPLLISRADAEAIVAYLVHERKLVPRRPPPRPEPAAPVPIAAPPELPPAAPAPPSTPPLLPSTPPPAAPPPSPLAVSTPAEPEDLEAEALGPPLVARRCSRCHTLYRVFTRIDSVPIGDLIIERMRRKTGSGISPDDAQVLRRFLRVRAAR